MSTLGRVSREFRLLADWQSSLPLASDQALDSTGRTNRIYLYVSGWQDQTRPPEDAFQTFWPNGGATRPPIEEVARTIVFGAASDGKQRHGTLFRPAALRPSQSDDYKRDSRCRTIPANSPVSPSISARSDTRSTQHLPGSASKPETGASHDSWQVKIATLETLKSGNTREHGTDSIQQTGDAPAGIRVDCVRRWLLIH